MTKPPPPIPEGYGTVTPWVVTSDTRRLLASLTVNAELLSARGFRTW
jgi:hypothetical protein